MEHFTCSSSSLTTFPANFFIPHTNKKNPKHHPTVFYVKASKKQSKKTLSRILTTEAAVQGIERRALSARSTRLWPKSVLEALTGAITNNQWESALKIFELLRKQDWYVPRCQTYTKLFVMLGKCKQPGYASLLYEKMVAEGLKSSIDVYTSLVSVYGLSGHFQEAFGIVDDMKSVTDCKPDIYTYSILINCCSKFRRFDLIERALDDMSYLGIECSIVTYNTLIDGYGKAEMFERMEKLLDDMTKNNKCLPDVYTMNSFLWAYGNVGEIKEMERWYEKFQLMEVQSDIKTFNILIRSYGKARMHDKMEKVIDFMKKRFCSPTTVTFNILIEMFGRVGNIVKMEYYFRMMKYKGVKPNSVTYCSLVNFYSKAEELNKISLILRQVENSDVVLDTPIFNCVISAYGQVGELQRMEEMFVEMKRRKCMPDNVTFATMIQATKPTLFRV